MKRLLWLGLLFSSISFASDCADKIPLLMGKTIEVKGQKVNLSDYYCQFGDKFNVDGFISGGTIYYTLEIETPKYLKVHFKSDEITKLQSVGFFDKITSMTAEDEKLFYDVLEKTYKVTDETN